MVPSLQSQSPRPPTLVLVEGHLALRKGIELLLRSEGFDVIGVADDAEHGIEVIRRRQPDAALVDIVLPGLNGVELARRVLATEPHAGIVLYGDTTDPSVLSGALECGARGVVMKAAPPGELISALGAVAAGGTRFDRRLAPLMATDRGGSGRVLSAREREILDLLAKGKSGSRISRELMISSETVRTHVRNAMRKLAARTRAHAVALALQRHEISF